MSFSTSNPADRSDAVKGCPRHDSRNFLSALFSLSESVNLRDMLKRLPSSIRGSFICQTNRTLCALFGSPVFSLKYLSLISIPRSTTSTQTAWWVPVGH